MINECHQVTDVSAAECAFRDLVKRLGELCAAERDIADLRQGDPAFDDWFRDAENARKAVLISAEAVLFTPMPTPTDTRYRALARNFEAMLLAQTASNYMLYHQFFSQTDWLYYVAGRGPKAARTNALLQRFREHLRDLLAFPDYGLDPPPALETCTSDPDMDV